MKWQYVHDPVIRRPLPSCAQRVELVEDACMGVHDAFRLPSRSARVKNQSITLSVFRLRLTGFLSTASKVLMSNMDNGPSFIIWHCFKQMCKVRATYDDTWFRVAEKVVDFVFGARSTERNATCSRVPRCKLCQSVCCISVAEVGHAAGTFSAREMLPYEGVGKLL